MKEIFRVNVDDSNEGGSSLIAWQPKGDLFAAATTGAGKVRIFHRHGDQSDEIPLTEKSKILALEWDKNGEILAILQEQCEQIPLWEARHRQLSMLETELSDPTFLKWSKVGSLLAIGTRKGNFLLYDSQTRKKTQVLGKHPGGITCGAWSRKNMIALGSDDMTLTISNDVGDTLEQTDLKHEPLQMIFCPYDRHGSQSRDKILSINLGGKSIFLHDTENPETPVELTFDPEYGAIVSHEWYGEGFLLVGFSKGRVVAFSTQMSTSTDVTREIWACQIHGTSLRHFSYSACSKRAAAVGGGGIEIIKMTNDAESITNDTIPVNDVDMVAWSPDGQVLTASTSSGYVYGFLAYVPSMYATHGTKIVFLSSLREVTCVDVTSATEPKIHPLGINPTKLALGPRHIAAAQGDRFIFHDMEKASQIERNYKGEIKEICLNSQYAAVLEDEQIILHEIESMSDDHNESCFFLDKDDDDLRKGATCLALTEDFLVFGTDSGTIKIYSLEERQLLKESVLRHTLGITMLSLNALGTRLVFVDSEGNGFVFNPVSFDVTPIPDFPPRCDCILWDMYERDVIILFDKSTSELHTYVYASSTIRGPLLTKLGPSEIDDGGGISTVPRTFVLGNDLVPIMSYAGEIKCQSTRSGALISVSSLAYYFCDNKVNHGVSESRRLQFTQNLALLKLENSWKEAVIIDRREYWLALANKAMQLMNVEIAIRVYRYIGDAGMVMGLERLQAIEDKNLLAGYVSMLFMDYEMAQELFLVSCRPRSALEMRCDLLHWEEALTLAKSLAPKEVPRVSAEYAHQLESRGDFNQALMMFEQALRGFECENDSIKTNHHCNVSSGGIARTSLHLGNLSRGIRLAKEIDDPALSCACADILVSIQQFSEAANLYELGAMFEKAAEIYIKERNLSKTSKIIDEVTIPKLLLDFAQLCEEEGDFLSAARAYMRAHDLDSVVRLYLGPLNQPSKAIDLVRSSRSSSGATMVAKYCRENSNIQGAIEFLLLASQRDSAFELAQNHDCMDVFANMVGDDMSVDDARKIAHYYETQQDIGKAGRFYSIGGQYKKALHAFLQCGDERLNEAIEVVGKARDDAITHILIDFLMGETDGEPKDPEYVYKLYMALGNYSEAANTAHIIAQQEQRDGDYSKSHAIIFKTIQQLDSLDIPVPQRHRQMFVLLHSYHLVKIFAKMGDHEATARLLLRVSKQVSKFPKHQVRILISTVIECQKSGLKNSAYEWATYICSNQSFKTELEATKFKKKIQAIIRRPNRDEKPEDLTPCPISSQLIPATSLECPTTKDAIPFCVCTGKHMILDDWCFCPVSGMPALYSEYVTYIQMEAIEETDAKNGSENEKDGEEEVLSSTLDKSEENLSIVKIYSALDPVCGKKISSADLKKCSKQEALNYIKKYNTFVGSTSKQL